MSGETKRPTMSLPNKPMERRLERNNNVNNEKKICIFLNDKITLHQQNE